MVLLYEIVLVMVLLFVIVLDMVLLFVKVLVMVLLFVGYNSFANSFVSIKIISKVTR